MNERTERLSELPSRASLFVRLTVILASLGFLTCWSVRLIGRRNNPSPSYFQSLADFSRLEPLPAEPYIVILVLAVALFIGLRKPVLVSSRNTGCLMFLTLVSFAAPITFSFGYYVVLLVVAALSSVFIAALLPRPEKDKFREETESDVRSALFLWLLATAVMSAFSMHRHASFGSGSWDMGCMIHNFYRASRFLGSTSTVLGDVDFLGDHFMLGIYLYAPLYWISSSGYMLLLIQSVNVAAAAPAIFLVARAKGAPSYAAATLALATAFSFGLQSAAYFDSHEITVGFGFLCWAIWALEKERLKTALVLLIIFSLFKESLGAYVVGFGLYALYQGIARDDTIAGDELASRRQWWVFGFVCIAYGVIWFVLVNRVFMPALIATANAPEPHETFADFGPTVFSALLGILQNPMKALAALFLPATKMQSHLVTFGGFAWLPIISPQIGIAALPLFAERFLSSKTTMWEMGYHYAAPLSFYAGWAVASGWGRLTIVCRRCLDGLGDWFGDRSNPFLSVLVLSSTVLICAAGYSHPSNFLRWEMSYFSPESKVRAHNAAIRLLEEQGVNIRISAQNRLLPHLADRPVIYRLMDWQKTDWVLLSVGENAWPKPDGYPKKLAKRLWASKDWELVFSQESTAVFARLGKHSLSSVSPSAVLGLGD